MGWQMIFYIAIGIMLISLVFAIAVFGNVLETAEKKFDIHSFVLSAFAFGGITLGVGNIGTYPFVSLPALLPLVIGCVASLLFIRRQFSSAEPFLDLRIVRYR